MSKSTSRPKTMRGATRLFVALYPPASIVNALTSRLQSVSLPAHRPTPPAQIHLTLQFIGDVPRPRVDSVIESVARAAGGVRAFELQPLRLITLPSRGPARLVAAETTAPAPLLELKSRLVARLAQRPRRDRTDRFRPHLTVCRFRPPVVLPPFSEPVEIEPFVVDAISLMRSELSAGGAHHHVVSASPLKG